MKLWFINGAVFWNMSRFRTKIRKSVERVHLSPPFQAFTEPANKSIKMAKTTIFVFKPCLRKCYLILIKNIVSYIASAVGLIEKFFAQERELCEQKEMHVVEVSKVFLFECCSTAWKMILSRIWRNDQRVVVQILRFTSRYKNPENVSSIIFGPTWRNETGS